MTSNATAAHGASPSWTPERPRFRPLRVLAAWLVSGLALLVAAAIVPHASVEGLGGAIIAAALIAVLNAVLPPIVAALRLPFALVAGFLLVLVLDALMLLLSSRIAPNAIHVDSFWWALVTALLASAVTIVSTCLRDERRRHVHVPRRPANRAPVGRSSA